MQHSDCINFARRWILDVVGFENHASSRISHQS